jgi:hypothetical protein
MIDGERRLTKSQHSTRRRCGAVQGRQWARGGEPRAEGKEPIFQQGRQAGRQTGWQAGRPASQHSTARHGAGTRWARTRLHSVPSAFQLVTAAVVLRNMRNPTLAILSAVSRKSLHLWVLLLARYSSIRRCPMLNPLQVAGAVILRVQAREVWSGSSQQCSAAACRQGGGASRHWQRQRRRRRRCPPARCRPSHLV